MTMTNTIGAPMKLTPRQQEMYDGKHGEAKKFCMDKLVDFGLAVGATEMVDLSLVLCGVPIWSKNPRNPETLAKLNAYDLGHSRLYDPIFAMGGARTSPPRPAACAETIRTLCRSTRSTRRATPGTSRSRARAASRSTTRCSGISRRVT